MSERQPHRVTVWVVVALVIAFALVGGYVELRLTSGTSWVW